MIDPTITSQDSMLVVSNPRESESEEKPQKSLNEKQQVSILMNPKIHLLRHAEYACHIPFWIYTYWTYSFSFEFN